jgi:signal transduction histidine kinase
VKSKYFLTLFLVAILPVCVLAGVYFFMASMEKPAAVAPPVDNAAVGASISALSTDLGTQASSLQNNITSAYKTLPNLVANHGDADLERFFKTTNGLECVEIYTYDGKKLKTVPANVQLADTSYGSSDEFKKIVTKFQENPGREDLFYTTRFNFPAFVFSVSLDGKTMVQAIMNLSRFFQNTDPYNGEMIFLDGDSGQIFYDSIASKNQTAFNPTQDAWLDKIQKSLQAKQSGRDTNPPSLAAVWNSLGIKSFGLIHTVPFSALQPKNTAAPKAQGPEGFERVFQSDTGRYVLLAAAALLGWILLMGALGLGMILGPLKKAGSVVLKAAQGQGELTPQMAQSFGKDDVGQMVLAAASLMQKLQNDRQTANQEKEDAIRRAKSEADAKSREAANQVSAAQQSASAARNDANDKNQQLNDKLKELDALKSMSEGLRNQTEQAKAEIGKLKGQVSAAEQGKADTQLQLTQTQYKLEGQLKEMEAKLLSAVAASSAIQVSQVRAAAIRTMSEELKTTLGIIKGYVSSALGTAQGGINEKQQEFLGMVINRSARLEKFINDLLDIYQVEIELAGAAHEEVNLAAEIEGLAFNFQAQADVKNIKLKVEPKGTIPKVPIVRRRFNQLWNILYLQIIKDAPRGSSITIGVEPLGDTVKVTVQDPGLNVATESLPKMFDEFYDPKHPASPQLAGTGLKFALVKTILAAHGGGAVAEKADPGTQLILTFPTQVKKPGEASKPISAIPASPSLSAPGAKMPPAAAPRPAVAAPAAPSVPGAAKPAPPAVPGAKPVAPGVPGMAAAVRPPASVTPGAPAAAGTPAAKSPASGFLDSLISKSQPVNVTPGAVKPAVPGTPVPGMPAAPKPLVPGAPAAPAVPGAIKPPAPAVPGMPTAPKPPVPGAPAAGAPAAPKPPMPAGASSLDALLKAPGAAPAPAAPGAPAVPKPPMPGVPPAAPGIKPPAPIGVPPAAGAPPAPGAPKVVPTTLKPTAPPPGILDMDSVDGVKTSVPPKPAAPAMPPKPAMPGAPGAPMPPGAAPKPPAPGIPPGGLDASKAQKPKDDGDLID